MKLKNLMERGNLIDVVVGVIQSECCDWVKSKWWWLVRDNNVRIRPLFERKVIQFHADKIKSGGILFSHHRQGTIGEANWDLRHVVVVPLWCHQCGGVTVPVGGEKLPDWLKQRLAKSSQKCTLQCKRMAQISCERIIDLSQTVRQIKSKLLEKAD